jgi:hypothetical protein
MLSALLPLLFASTVFATPLARQNTRQYTVHNQCPTPITLYIGGVKDVTIASKGTVVKTLGTGAGFFYTDANGGSPTAQGTIRAGFYDVRSFWFLWYHVDGACAFLGLLLYGRGP